MNRHNMVETVGVEYHQSNIEGGEWSYAKDAGDLATLAKKLGSERPEHYKLDIRFYDEDDTGKYAVLIETKQNFKDSDAAQLATYSSFRLSVRMTEKKLCVIPTR